MMRTPVLRHLPAVAALALVSLAAAACSSAPVQALPVQTPSAAPSTAVPADPPPTPKPKPTHTSTDPPCRGAVVYRISAADTGPAWPRLCISVGGVLQVRDLGPEGFTQSPSAMAECEYEGAVRTCRLLHPGTVRFTTDNGRQVRKLTLDIASASSPPKPSPACMNARTTFPLDPSDAGPSWWAICMKLGAVLRVGNLGPEGLTVTPPNAVSCHYEAAIHQCRLVKPGIVTVTTAGTGGIRSLTVVAIR
jgi:hypothetical protein